jgi:hypothetical protein
MRRLHLPACILIFTITLYAHADAPLTMADIKDKPGVSTVKLTGHSPLSDPKLIIKRLGSTSDAHHAIPDPYDFSGEDIYVYLPAHPADDEKFGLLVGACVGGHQYPPPAWVDVLEKQHLIWTGVLAFNDPSAHLRSIALLLDAADNATKTWSIDPRRTYILVAGVPSGPEAAMPMYYPEVFGGLISWCIPPWFNRLTDPKTKSYFPPNVPRPPSDQLSKAKSTCRFVLAYPIDSSEGPKAPDLAFKAYKTAGFKFVKAVPTDPEKISDYTANDSQWFEQSIEFLDSSATQSKPATSKPTR